MKRFSLKALSAGLGLALLAAPLAMAQPYPDHHGGYGHPMPHQWHHGDRFNGHREVVSDWQHYHVRRPPHGYEWVHNGNQLVMIAIGTGLVASTLALSHGY
jgi:hypothetical protein